jgi:Putative DNA-binding domain
MIVKPVSKLEISDIRALIGTVAESRYIDFKQSVIGRADADRKEFVADVTAFANASGGHIVFGVAEGPDAVAANIAGLAVADRDEEERRLSDMIRNGTEPRLSDFEFKWIDDQKKSSVLVLHVPRSWRSPHRVTLAGHSQFYIRNSRGKHPMNTDELRTAFTYGRALEENIARFREARINAIRKQEAPIVPDAGPLMIVHGMPMVSFADPPTITFAPRELLLPPLGGGGYNLSYTLEGTVSHQPSSMAYTLHFRNGILEGVMPALSCCRFGGHHPKLTAPVFRTPSG